MLVKKGSGITSIPAFLSGGVLEQQRREQRGAVRQRLDDDMLLGRVRAVADRPEAV